MMSAPVSRTVSGFIAFTVAAVPTGMKAGVRISPRGIRIVPVRAAPSLAAMVKAGEDFLVYDAKTGEDITRSVLAQIIFEQENKAGQNLLPTTFLRQLIRFYGDSMQMVVPKYLEQSIDTLTREQEKFRRQLTDTFSGTPFAPLEEHVRRNMELFQQTFSMFKPFTPSRGGAPDTVKMPEPSPDDGNIDDLRKQMKEMQERLERMSKEPKKEE